MKTLKERFVRRHTGFTLMELVIVVVVIGIIAGMAVPSFLSYLPKQRVKATARDMVSELRLARSQSISERQAYGVTIDLSKQSFTYFADADGDGTLSAGDSTITADTVSTDVKITTCTFTNNTVVFGSTGSASSSGDLQVVSSDGQVIMSINVLASTGRVRLTEIGAG